jgi:hypothetical protein
MPVETGAAFRYWRDPLFLLCLAAYAINRALIKPNLHHYSPFFHGHLNDSLTVPVALPLYLLVYRRIGLRPDDEPPRSWEVGLHLAVWIFFFKWFGPVMLQKGAADPVDGWCMLAGGILAWGFWQRERLLEAAEKLPFRANRDISHSFFHRKS